MDRDWKGRHYAFFCNRECEYFPCHPGADPENFNCLFCYCPLYLLGDRCGGNFRYRKNGVKDCTNCLSRTGGKITGKLYPVTRKFWPLSPEGKRMAVKENE